MTERFSAGSIFRYPYLWRWQGDRGREHGEKDRPVCLVLAIADRERELTHLVILPISKRPPQEGHEALEVPPIEMRRGGLSEFKRCWLTVSEYNYDIAERSFHLDQRQEPMGRFGPAFLERIRQAFRPMLAARRGRVDRIG